MKKLFSLLLVGLLTLGSVETTNTFFKSLAKSMGQNRFIQSRIAQAVNKNIRKNWKKYFFYYQITKKGLEVGILGYLYGKPFLKERNTWKQAHEKGKSNCKEGIMWFIEHAICKPTDSFLINLMKKITPMPQMPNKTCTQVRAKRNNKTNNAFQKENNFTYKLWSMFDSGIAPM